jgi:RNA polymerase sigma-70 factor (ECF subfamily)
VDDHLPVLVRRVLDGDVDAVATLVARFRPRFSRFARRMLGNREDAEEALQDTFVRMYRRIGTCRDPALVEAWTFRILVNRCRTAVARSGRTNRFMAPADPERNDPGVDHPADASAWREEIDRALAALPAEQREAFLLRHVEDLSYGEMAGLTGAGVSALKMRVMRACEALRRELEGARDE